jgi:hypothetical protein
LATDPEARGFDSRHYQEKKVLGLERDPLSLVSTTEELLDRKVEAPVYKTENTAIGIRHADHVAPSIRKKLAFTSPTSGGRSVGMVRSRTQTMEVFIIGKIEYFRRRKDENIFVTKNQIIILEALKSVGWPQG